MVNNLIQKGKPVILKHLTAEQTCTQICDSKQVLLQHCTAGKERIEGESKVIKHDTCSQSSISSSIIISSEVSVN